MASRHIARPRYNLGLQLRTQKLTTHNSELTTQMTTTIEKANRPAYLANVLSIAKINGDVSVTESLALRSIIHRIGATQNDLVAAGKLLTSGRYKMQAAKALNERMDNLQDMVMVALADGDADTTETAPIEQIAKQMHYSQADIDLAVRRAELALRRIGTKRTPASKRPVSQQAPQPLPKTGTVAKAKKPAAIHQTPVRAPLVGAPVAAPVQPPKPDIDDAEGVSPSPACPTKSEERSRDTLPAPIKACMACRANSENQETYCFGVPDGPFNPWGCRLSNMPWEPDAAWLGLGHFRDDATFIFDKHAIAERLAANLAGALNCPHLDTEYTETAFDCFPERITIGERWRYRHANADDANAITIRTTNYIHGCAVSSTATVDGIDPVGIRDALKIVRKAAHRTGRNTTLCDKLRVY